MSTFFHPFGKAREEVLLGADAYISLSHRENLNHTAAEAMTGGQALILSPGNDLQYSFPCESSFGWLLGSDKEDEVIAALQSFDAASPDRIEEMGRSGKEWALEKLSFELFQQKLQALYREATQN